MQAVDEEPVETIHLYVVREGEKRPSLIPAILSIFALSFLVAIGVLLPYQQPEIRTTIRVPAVLLPLKTFNTSVAVNATGSKTYPATTARGILILTNGSILSQELPQGMIFTAKNGVEVVTDAAVFVPAGNASAFGVATVSAHALVSGLQGNLRAFAIDQVYGTSLYIRNLHSFTGGQNAYSVKFITSKDRQISLSQARQSLMQQTLVGLLPSPCTETVTGSQTVHVTWTCQFVTYHSPQGKVLHAEVHGQVVVLDIVVVERPRILTTK
jgi:hypothetical protein